MTELWIKSNLTGAKIEIPVNPPKLEVTNGSQNESISVNRLGEVTILQDPTLKEFNFSSFFPAYFSDYDDPLVSSAKQYLPWSYVKIIEGWKKEGQPVRFIVTGTPINYDCSIEDFSYNEAGGDVGTLNYSITLKQFQHITVTVLDKGKPVKKKPARPSPSKNTPKIYVVKSGDSLYKIAQKVLGKGSRWEEIYEKNKKLIGKNSSDIKAGQRLVMP